MSPKNIILTTSLLLLTAGAPRMAPAQTAPPGWQSAAVGGRAVFTPPDLGPSEFYQVTVYPPAPLAGMPLTGFVDGVAARETAVLGKESAVPIPAKANNPSAATATHTFTTPQGRTRVAVFTALSLDGENARVVGIVLSDIGVLRRYLPQQTAMIADVLRQEKATQTPRAMTPRAMTPRGMTPGMTPGGKVVPGIYAGNAVYSNDGKIANQFRVYLYDGGECQVCNARGEELRFGADAYSYDPVTGRMDIGNTLDLNNSVLGPDDGFCLYGRDADGKPCLYARSDRGYAYLTTALHYVGPTDRPSPKQREAAKAAAEAEAKRYKYVLAPGKGVQPAQIAGVFHLYKFRYNLSPIDESYLLLKDGTVHDGLPVPPDELDVSLSRRREPEKWGKWRRQGAAIEAAWPDQSNHFAPLQGEMAALATIGERLSGRYGTGETIGSMVTGGSYRLWGVTFTPDGRFLKDGRGGTSSGSLGTTMNGVSADTVYDDEGSATVISAPAVGGGVTRKKPGGHRAGAYSVSGYTLTLHYDDGRVARLPFFFETAKRDQIYFEGATLGLDAGK